MRNATDLDARAVVLQGILDLRSTARLLRDSSMSMKSTTMRPARSRNLSCLAISSAASILVRNAVSSMLCSRVERPELTSICDESLGLVDDDISARLQGHLVGKHRVELALDSRLGEDGLCVPIKLH